MLAILFQEKTKKMLVFPKNAEKNASTIEKGLVANDDCLCGVQDEKTTLQAERSNLNSKLRKALLTLSARAETGESDGITACFAMR